MPQDEAKIQRLDGESRKANHDLALKQQALDSTQGAAIQAKENRQADEQNHGTALTQANAPQRQRATARDVDKNLRLLRARSYASLTPDQQGIELGLAVTASACVPALFHLLALSALYPGIRVELVDGGVHDNQGVQGLLDEHCTRLVISDASGEMDDALSPATRAAQPGAGALPSARKMSIETKPSKATSCS